MSDNRRFSRFASGDGGALTEQPEQENSLIAADNEIFGGEMPLRHRQAVMPDNALVKRDDGAFVYKQFVMTATEMTIPEGTSEDDWTEAGDVLRGIGSAVSWWIGDWAVYARDQWGATAKQIAEAFGYEVETIEPYMSVCGAVHGLIRNQAVSFSHCRRVAKMDAALQERWIQFAAMHGLVLEDFKVEIRAIDHLPYDARIAKLNDALSQSLLITQLPGMKPPTPSKPDRTQEQVKHFSAYVKNEQDNVPYMKPQQKKDFADRAKWLGEHYLKLAKWAMGEEE